MPNDSLDLYKKLIEERPEDFLQNKMLKIITDENEIKEFCSKNNKQVGVCYKSNYNMVVVDLVEDFYGNKFLYERMMPTVRGDAVAVIVKCEDRYIFLDQFRHASRKSLFCLPRGYGESGVSAEDNARKELTEELGVSEDDILSVKIIGKTVANSGICGEEISIGFCEINGYNFKKNEEIDKVFSLEEQEVIDYMANGKIVDGISLSAWAIYKSLF